MDSLAADEPIDLLDENGLVVGVVKRGEMRRRRLPHRCVYLLVFNSQGDLLIHQRTASKDVFPSHWDVTFGGVVATGESFDAAAQREGREELGIEVNPIGLFPIRYSDESTNVFAMVYRARSDGPFHFQVEEVVRGEFVTLSKLEERIARDRFCPDGLAVWAEYRQRAGV
jgi:isopentenyldiphosphate isomerase